jgi:hypothetical protein
MCRVVNPLKRQHVLKIFRKSFEEAAMQSRKSFKEAACAENS